MYGSCLTFTFFCVCYEKKMKENDQMNSTVGNWCPFMSVSPVVMLLLKKQFTSPLKYLFLLTLSGLSFHLVAVIYRWTVASLLGIVTGAIEQKLALIPRNESAF